MIEAETVIEVGRHSIDEMREIDDNGEMGTIVDEWYCLRIDSGDKSDVWNMSIPFDTVEASGSLIKLKRGGKTSNVINGDLTGKNEIVEDPKVPREILEELKSIGPW